MSEAVLRGWDLVTTDISKAFLQGVTYEELAEALPDQPNPGICSAFLVGPDLLATSGQCLSDDSDCGRFAFVFGCRMERPGVPILDFDASQVYFCEGILQNRVEGQGADWAVVRVDREVDGREPFAVRREGQVEEGQELLAMGHPFGLPLKVSAGAVVRAARQPEIFVAVSYTHLRAHEP